MADFYQNIKSLVDNFTFLSRDVLHVYGGVLFFMFWIVVFKKQRQILCLTIISIAALVNEILDILFVLKRTNNINWTENISDIFNTIFLPFLLYLFLRFWNK